MVKLSWASAHTHTHTLPLSFGVCLFHSMRLYVFIGAPLNGNLSNMRVTLSLSPFLSFLLCFFSFCLLISLGAFFLSHLLGSFWNIIRWGWADDANQLYLGGYYFQQCDTDKLIKYTRTFTYHTPVWIADSTNFHSTRLSSNTLSLSWEAIKYHTYINYTANRPKKEEKSYANLIAWTNFYSKSNHICSVFEKMLQ